MLKNLFLLDQMERKEEILSLSPNISSKVQKVMDAQNIILIQPLLFGTQITSPALLDGVHVRVTTTTGSFSLETEM